MSLNYKANKLKLVSLLECLPD